MSVLNRISYQTPCPYENFEYIFHWVQYALELWQINDKAVCRSCDGGQRHFGSGKASDVDEMRTHWQRTTLNQLAGVNKFINNFVHSVQKFLLPNTTSSDAAWVYWVPNFKKYRYMRSFNDVKIYCRVICLLGFIDYHHDVIRYYLSVRVMEGTQHAFG